MAMPSEMQCQAAPVQCIDDRRTNLHRSRWVEEKPRLPRTISTVLIPADLLLDKNIPPKAIGVYAALAAFANNITHHCSIAEATICLYSKISNRDTVREMINILVDAKYVVKYGKRRTHKQKKNNTNIYILTHPIKNESVKTVNQRNGTSKSNESQSSHARNHESPTNPAKNHQSDASNTSHLRLETSMNPQKLGNQSSLVAPKSGQELDISRKEKNVNVSSEAKKLYVEALRRLVELDPKTPFSPVDDEHVEILMRKYTVSEIIYAIDDFFWQSQNPERAIHLRNWKRVAIKALLSGYTPSKWIRQEEKRRKRAEVREERARINREEIQRFQNEVAQFEATFSQLMNSFSPEEIDRCVKEIKSNNPPLRRSGLDSPIMRSLLVEKLSGPKTLGD
jgi:hypothetical protein